MAPGPSSPRASSLMPVARRFRKTFYIARRPTSLVRRATAVVVICTCSRTDVETSVFACHRHAGLVAAVNLAVAGGVGVHEIRSRRQRHFFSFCKIHDFTNVDDLQLWRSRVTDMRAPVHKKFLSPPDPFPPMDVANKFWNASYNNNNNIRAAITIFTVNANTFVFLWTIIFNVILSEFLISKFYSFIGISSLLLLPPDELVKCKIHRTQLTSRSAHVNVVWPSVFRYRALLNISFLARGTTRSARVDVTRESLRAL